MPTLQHARKVSSSMTSSASTTETIHMMMSFLEMPTLGLRASVNQSVTWASLHTSPCHWVCSQTTSYRNSAHRKSFSDCQNIDVRTILAIAGSIKCTHVETRTCTCTCRCTCTFTCIYMYMYCTYMYWVHVDVSTVRACTWLCMYKYMYILDMSGPFQAFKARPIVFQRLLFGC